MMPTVSLAAAAAGTPSQPQQHSERSFIMLKPDGVHRGLVGDVLKRFEQRGYKLVGIKVLVPTADLARKHYAEHEGKPFFPKLVDFLSSGPVVVRRLLCASAARAVVLGGEAARGGALFAGHVTEWRAGELTHFVCLLLRSTLCPTYPFRPPPPPPLVPPPPPGAGHGV